MTRNQKDPTFNPFSVLADELVVAKVAKKKKTNQNPVVPPVQQQAPPPNPLPAHRQQLLTAARNKLTTNGFAVRTNTYVHTLGTRVVHEQMDVGAHLTINKTDLQDQVNLAQLNDNVLSVLQQTKYHVTVEEYDDENDARNPRWYSAGNNQWRMGNQSAFRGTTLQDVPTVQDAIDEADGIIDLVRQ